jgi:diguanylate cyclase (GGDEF)-like protein
MADIDCLKQINDQYGHPAGDAVLRQVARCIQLELREYDGIGRFGGEEFMFVLPGCDAAAAVVAMERVRLRIRATPVPWGGASIPVAVSAGVAWTAPEGLNAAGLIQAADDALYRAKALGRDRIEVWAPTPAPESQATWLPTTYQAGTGFPGHATASLPLLTMAV